MRSFLPALLFLALGSQAGAQTCRKVPPPFLPGLFPEAVMGLKAEFATNPTGGCSVMFRPASEAERESRPWAMVSAEAITDPVLGESADDIRTRFGSPPGTLLTVADWPVAVRLAPLGDEYSAHKGSVHVVVLVRNGDHGQASEALARALLEKILPKVPCGT